MLIDNVHEEFWLRQSEGDGRFGPFYNLKEVYECVRKEELRDYVLQKVLAYIPF